MLTACHGSSPFECAYSQVKKISVSLGARLLRLAAKSGNVGAWENLVEVSQKELTAEQVQIVSSQLYCCRREVYLVVNLVHVCIGRR